MTKPKQDILKRLKKEPLIKFLIISVVIYMAYGFFGVKDEETLAKENTIFISSQEIDMMSFAFQQRLNRKPTEKELQKLIDKRVKETVLYEEAKKMGLDKDDVVIKRRVVLQYRNLVEGLLIPPDPTEEELMTYFQENIAAYIPEEVLSITQIFFDPDKREESTLEDAEKTLLVLQNRESLPDNYNAYGDNFMLANVYTDITPLELRKYFGRGFAESVMQLEPNIWTGPVLSGYGTHLVYVNKKQVPDAPLLEEVKESVLSDYMGVKQEEIIKIYMESVIAKYEVITQEEKKVNK